MNTLQEMLTMQKNFQERLGTNFDAMGFKQTTDFVKEHSIHLNQEINEMLYELPFFKPWKDYSNMTLEEQCDALEKAQIECIDAWHFFMNIMLALGIDAERLYTLYMQKNAENHRRQDAGYNADVSYKDQKPEDIALPICKVSMNGEDAFGSDFISVISEPDGNASLYYNTDILTIGMAIKMLMAEYDKLMAEYTPEELNEVAAALGIQEDNNE